MATISKDQILNYRGETLVDRDGDKIGTIAEIYLDTTTNEPEWALVNTGLFGTKHSFVPLTDATESGGTLSVPFEKAVVKDAPKVDPDGQLSEQEESDLYRHYGRDYTTGGGGAGLGSGDVDTSMRTDAGYTGTDRDVTDRDLGDRDLAGGTADRASFGGAPAVGNDVSGPETDNAMTRSEEELRVGKTERETGRVRLRKYIVTEDVTQTVPVRREEVRVEREPITDANIDSATSGADLSEEEHEVVLHAEEPVAEKRVVPKERVRLDKDEVTEERTVSEEVRSERIDVDDDTRRA